MSRTPIIRRGGHMEVYCPDPDRPRWVPLAECEKCFFHVRGGTWVVECEAIENEEGVDG